MSKWHVDLVEIKADVKAGKLMFYVKDGKIYCEDMANGEVVLVGEDSNAGNNQDHESARRQTARCRQA